MTDIPGCPEVTELHQWLLDRLPDADAERLEQHLEQCAHCGQALDTLEREDALVPVVRARANIAGTRDEVVEQVMVRLKELYATADLPTGPLEGTPSAGLSTGDEELGLPVDVTREVYAVLAGTEHAGSLGRLGTYRILKVLGAGGMGVVFQAEDEQLQRQVALKVIRPALAGSSGARQRFLAEARATAAIEHDHIVTIHQVGEDRGVLFLAMPLLKGETLEARLKREGKLAVGEVHRIGREIAEGLAAAHESKLIHRDIKPSNIWLEGKSGRVKILDFGLAQAMDDPGHMTRSGTVAGTPQYMAPEQAAGSRVDARCDLFSLGCVLYRLATGTLPFRGANTMQVLRALERDQPRPPHAIDPEVPVALSELIMQLLAKDREERPPHAHGVVETLQRLAALPQSPAPPLPHERVEAAKSQSLDQEGARTPMTTEVEIPSGRPPRRVRRPIVVAAVLVGIAGFGGGSLFYLQGVHTASGDRRVAEEKVPAAVPALPPAEPPGEIRCMRGHTGAVGPVACSGDGRLALSGGWDNSMRLWDLATGTQLHCFEGSRGWVWSVAFSADDRRALSVGTVDRTVRLWDVASGQELGSLWKPDERFLAVAFLPDGPHAVADGGEGDNTLRLWQVERAKEVRRFEGHTDRVWRVAFSPDGRRLLSGGRDKTARLWEVATGKQVQRFEGHAAAVLAVALSPDSRRVLTGSGDGTLRLWDAESGQPLRHFDGHQDAIQSVAFAPDGRRALSGGQDKVLRLWDVDSGQMLCHLEGHTELIGGVAFAPDGRQAISGGADGTVRLWRLPP